MFSEGKCKKYFKVLLSQAWSHHILMYFLLYIYLYPPYSSCQIQSIECKCHPWWTIYWQQEGFREAPGINRCWQESVQVWAHQGREIDSSIPFPTKKTVELNKKKNSSSIFSINIIKIHIPIGVLQSWSVGYSGGDARWETGYSGDHDSGSLQRLRHEERVCQDDGETVATLF